MKATCMQENLARGLAIVNRAIATRTTLPILSNILIETDKSRLKLSATNLEIGINCWVAARIEAEGATTVPARLLTDFVNSLPTEQIDLELNGASQTLKVSADGFRAEIKGIDASDFPILPTVEQGLHFSLDATSLREMIGQVTIAAATDESRPILTGVLTVLDPDAGRMTMAAADGFRLSVRRADLDSPPDEKVSVIIPARALLELGRITSDEDERIEVAVTDTRNQILFRLKSVDLVSQLIDGTFPDYERILPPSHTTRAVVQSKAMQNAVRLASFFARDAANIVRFEVQPGDELQPGTLVVSAQAAEVGGNQTQLEASVVGPAVQVAFNAKYMIDVVGAVGSDQIALELTTPTSPGVFRPVSEVDFTHVVMPMHLGQ
jgi:DNA polymerase III subunit beta